MPPKLILRRLLDSGASAIWLERRGSNRNSEKSHLQGAHKSPNWNQLCVYFSCKPRGILDEGRVSICGSTNILDCPTSSWTGWVHELSSRKTGVGVEASTMTPSAPWASSRKSGCYWAGWEGGPPRTWEKPCCGADTLEADMSNLCSVFK